MNGFIVIGKGRLTRNPMTVTAADSDFAKICLMNADTFYVETWFHAAGKLGALIDEKLTAGTEVTVKAEIHPKAGKLRYLRSPGEHVFLITEMEVDGKVLA
jgi:hypothetical protein